MVITNLIAMNRTKPLIPFTFHFFSLFLFDFVVLVTKSQCKLKVKKILRHLMTSIVAHLYEQRKVAKKRTNFSNETERSNCKLNSQLLV